MVFQTTAVINSCGNGNGDPIVNSQNKPKGQEECWAFNNIVKIQLLQMRKWPHGYLTLNLKKAKAKANTIINEDEDKHSMTKIRRNKEVYPKELEVARFQMSQFWCNFLYC